MGPDVITVIVTFAVVVGIIGCGALCIAFEVWMTKQDQD